jgi:hypothetical protein
MRIQHIPACTGDRGLVIFRMYVFLHSRAGNYTCSNRNAREILRISRMAQDYLRAKLTDYIRAFAQDYGTTKRRGGEIATKRHEKTQRKISCLRNYRRNDRSQRFQRSTALTFSTTRPVIRADLSAVAVAKEEGAPPTARKRPWPVDLATRKAQLAAALAALPAARRWGYGL